MAVLGAVTLTRDVNPIGSSIGGFFDELVEVAVVHDPGEPTVKDFHVGVMLAI